MDVWRSKHPAAAAPVINRPTDLPQDLSTTLGILIKRHVSDLLVAVDHHSPDGPCPPCDDIARLSHARIAAGRFGSGSASARCRGPAFFAVTMAAAAPARPYVG